MPVGVLIVECSATAQHGHQGRHVAVEGSHKVGGVDHQGQLGQKVNGRVGNSAAVGGVTTIIRAVGHVVTALGGFRERVHDGAADAAVGRRRRRFLWQNLFHFLHGLVIVRRHETAIDDDRLAVFLGAARAAVFRRRPRRKRAATRPAARTACTPTK